MNDKSTEVSVGGTLVCMFLLVAVGFALGVLVGSRIALNKAPLNPPSGLAFYWQEQGRWQGAALAFDNLLRAGYVDTNLWEVIHKGFKPLPEERTK